MRRLWTAVLVLWASWASGQGAVLVATPEGQPLAVTLAVAGMPSLLSAQGTVAYDPAVLALDSASALAWPSLAVGEPAAGTVVFSWYDAALAGQTPPASLLTLHFSWVDSTATPTSVALVNAPTPIEFIGPGFSVIPVTVGPPIAPTSGWTDPEDPPVATGTVAFSLDSLALTPGAAFTLPVRAAGFEDVLSCQGSLNYDPAALELVGIAPAALPGLNWTATDGAVAYSWYDDGLSSLTVPDGTTLFELEFTVLAPSGTTALAFSDFPVLREVIGADLAPRPAAYEGVTLPIVPAATPTATFTLPTLEAAPGSPFTLPIAASADAPIGSFQATIGLSGLTLTDVTAPALTGFGPANWSTDGETATISWFDPALDGVEGPVLLELHATAPAGVYPLTWTGFAEVATPEGVLFDASFEPGTLTVTEPSVGFVLEGGYAAGALTVHVVATQPAALLSFQTSLPFDAAQLAFTTAEAGVLPNFNAGNASGGPDQVLCSWFDPTLEGVAIAAGDSLFSLTWDVIGGADSTTVGLGGGATPYEVVGPGFVPYEVEATEETFGIQPGACTADVDGDCTVDLRDMLAFLTYFGCVGDCPGDFNGDGIVSMADFTVLLAGFGTQNCCD